MAATGTCTYLAAKELNLWFNGASYTFPGTFYLAIETKPAPGPTAAGVQDEVSSGNNYARLTVAANTTNFPTISATNVIVNGSSPLAFATASGAWTGNSGAYTTCTGIVIYDALTIGTGNPLFFGLNTTAETVVTNDVLQYTSGNFTITFN